MDSDGGRSGVLPATELCLCGKAHQRELPPQWGGGGHQVSHSGVIGAPMFSYVNDDGFYDVIERPRPPALRSPEDVEPDRVADHGGAYKGHVGASVATLVKWLIR